MEAPVRLVKARNGPGLVADSQSMPYARFACLERKGTLSFDCQHLEEALQWRVPQGSY